MSVDGRRVGLAKEVAKELLIIVVAALTYGGVRELTEGNFQTAVANGRAIQDLERTLGIASEGTVQSLILPHELLVDLVNWIYIWGHWPVIAVCGVGLFIFRRDSYRLLRTAVLISGAIGFLFFALLPTAPPRLTDSQLVDTVSQWSSSYRTLQPPSLTNQIAAMPSLHFGWNLLVGVTLFLATRSLLVRGFALAMPAAMAFAVVATANHWVFDVIAGATVVLVALAIAFWSLRRDTAPTHRRIGLPAAMASRGSARNAGSAGRSPARSRPRARPREAGRSRGHRRSRGSAGTGWSR